MENKTSFEAKPHRRGGIFSVVAILLAVVTLVGIFSYLSPASELSRALAKTQTALEKREDVSLFLASLGKSGSVTVEGDGLLLDYDATLPEAASLFVEKEGEEYALYASEDSLFLESEGETVSGARRGAYEALLEEEGVKEYLPLFAALADPALSEEEALSELGKKMIAKMRLSVKKEKAEMPVSGETASVYRIKISSEALLAALGVLEEEMEKEEICDALISRLDLALALLGKSNVSGEALLEGAVEGAEKLLEDTTLSLSFFVQSGKVREFALEGEWDKTEFSFTLALGQKTGDEDSLALSILADEKELFTLRCKGKVADDSDQAYIRTLSFEFSDGTGLFLPEPLSVELRYSWGRVRGDVGMRVITPTGELNVGGTMGEYKEGKTITLTISRLEWNKEKLLEGDLKISLSHKGEVTAPPASDGELF